jgi:hypothetical protein
MNMKKKSKKVKKYAVGGDLRRLPPVIEPGSPSTGSPSSLTFPFVGGGGGGDDGSATGQVKAISKAAGRAGDYLSTAGEAIGSGGQGGVRPGFPPPSTRYEEGGSVKKKPVKKNMGGMMKYKKGGKVKVRGAGKAIKGVRPAKMVKM